MTEYVTSADGTRIAFDRVGSGPPVILVIGAMQFRAFDPTTTEMATALASHGFTVVHYDRRGRGESPADPPITLEQTLDDLRALVADVTEGADDAVALFGSSSGGAISLAAAASGMPISKLVLWEVPLSEELGGDGAEFLAGLRERIAAGDGDATIEYFMKDMPREWLEGAKAGPGWPIMTAMGPSLEPDAEVLAWTQSAPRAELLADVTQPTLALIGDETLDFMVPAAESIVATLPNAQLRTIPAAEHTWEPKQMALTIAEFLVD
ncbi:alpha/beta fold hydrolase [Agromyces ramosus]|uniref:Pimeloyl-ACP methyl ester carboxylesterase n=1 Tax=Agromyces ramosus TaxID=33879 RepID=A0ABU0RAQ7_9MICO|nr:alpha/beta fold hydrolase [Agromyces ramosus]MDQ0894832.1 pimeloyl-ACP methyl ester carboxylesterase [Agromyces ramosus]